VSHPVRYRDEILPKVTEARLSSWDVVHALNMAIACLISYWIMTYILSRLVDRPSDFLGGMWAVAATVFVFRESQVRSLSAGIGRLIATCVSFALCLLYLLSFRFTPVGMAALIGIGTAAIMLVGRRDGHSDDGNKDHRCHGRRGHEPRGRLASAIAASWRHRRREPDRCCV